MCEIGKLFRQRSEAVDLEGIKTRQPVESDYRILVSRGRSRPEAKLYAFGMRQAIPAIPIPLLPSDPEPTLDLNAVVRALYERARFDLALDYAEPTVPALSKGEAAWARGIIAWQRGRRSTGATG
jgi:hypothetical protein